MKNPEYNDFIKRFRGALHSCGGNPASAEDFLNLPLGEVADILAPNGIRLCYHPSWHMNARPKPDRTVERNAKRIFDHLLDVAKKLAPSKLSPSAVLAVSEGSPTDKAVAYLIFLGYLRLVERGQVDATINYLVAVDTTKRYPDVPPTPDPAEVRAEYSYCWEVQRHAEKLLPEIVARAGRDPHHEEHAWVSSADHSAIIRLIREGCLAEWKPSRQLGRDVIFYVRPTGKEYKAPARPNPKAATLAAIKANDAEIRRLRAVNRKFRSELHARHQ